MKEKISEESLIEVEDQKFIVSLFGQFIYHYNLYHTRNLWEYIEKELSSFDYMGDAFKKLLLRRLKEKRKNVSKQNPISIHQARLFSLKYRTDSVVLLQDKYPTMVCSSIIQLRNISTYLSSLFKSLQYTKRRMI